MGRWIDLANSLRTHKEAGDNRDKRDNRPNQMANVPNVPSVPVHSSRDLLMLWEKGTASLDPNRPLGGYDPDRWLRILRDCDNLIADFGKSAAALGWSTIDMFGFPAGGAAGINLGGLAWRMHGGRLIAMDENCATFRSAFADRTSRFSQGYLQRVEARFVPVWELEA